MNIKQAKQEIVNTVHAYLAKDETGEYVSVVSIWYLTRSHIIRDRVRSVCLLSPIRSMEMRKSL